MRRQDSQVRIVGFMPTPFTDHDRVDVEQLIALTSSIAKLGIEPAVLGGMGEYYALDRDESRACMAAAKAGAGGVPVVAGVGWSTREAVQVATDAADLGVNSIVINPPHYAAPSPRAYAEHVRQISDAARTGAIVYSWPHFPLTDHYIEALVDVEGFRGIKEEHYSVEETHERIRRWGGRVEWWGVGEIGGSAYARAGADVVTTSIANIRPDLAVRAINAIVAGIQDSEAIEASREWERLLASDRDGAPAFLTEVMHQFAGWNQFVRLPLLPSAPSIREAIAAYLARWAPKTQEAAT